MADVLSLGLDLLLVLILLALAWAALESASPRRAVILYIAFGLVLALAWARLRAPDVALAEAAIGAGLSGALLLAATRDEPEPSPTATPERWTGIAITLLSIALGLVVAWALISALGMADPERLAGEVMANLAQSGVSNPVTAVLLNFRAYDTLLELAVLLAAVLGILALGPERTGYRDPGPVFAALARLLVPVLILTGGYLLWAGAHAPGGAFQAGAVLASAGVMLRLAGHPGAGLPEGLILRLVSVLGTGVFVAVGLAMTASGRVFLHYPPAWAGTLILVIETAAMLSIAAALVLAFAGGRPPGWASVQNQTAKAPRRLGHP